MQLQHQPMLEEYLVMPKLKSWRKGLSEGNRPLGIPEDRTLTHIEYKEDSNLVETDRGFQTILDSLHLGGQHRISSGGENVFFTNQRSDIAFFPVWQGVRDQHDPANHGSAGILEATTRIYEDLEVREAFGPLASEGAVEYQFITPVLITAAIYSVTVVVAEPVTPTQWLAYRLFFGAVGEDDTTLLTYENRVTGLDLAIGDEFHLHLDTPLEGFAGQLISISLNLSAVEDGPHTHLLVRPSATNPQLPYDSVELRRFKDVPIALRESVGCGEWGIMKLMDPEPNTLHLSNLEILSTNDCIPLIFNN